MKKLKELLEATGSVDLQPVKGDLTNLIRKAQDVEADCRAMQKKLKAVSVPAELESAYKEKVLDVATALVKGLQEAEKSLEA